MAVFLVRLETDFVEYYEKFYDAVRKGGTLQHIENMRNEMVYSARQGILEIIKIQSITVLIVFVAGPSLLRMLGHLRACICPCSMWMWCRPRCRWSCWAC